MDAVVEYPLAVASSCHTRISTPSFVEFSKLWVLSRCFLDLGHGTSGELKYVLILCFVRFIILSCSNGMFTSDELIICQPRWIHSTASRLV